MARTLPENPANHKKQFVVGCSETMVGHCVNVRDLGKLAFFTLRSQTSSLQVVCTEKSLIDELRVIQEYSLVEVTGIIKEKQRRRGQCRLEYELDAKSLTRLYRDESHAFKLASDFVSTREIFNCLEPVVKHAELIGAARTVLQKCGIIELPSPNALLFQDRQALAYFEQLGNLMTDEQRYCSHPPFHLYSRFLTAGGLHRFAFFYRTSSGRELLHIVLCRSDDDELQAIHNEIFSLIHGADADNLRSKVCDVIAHGNSPVDVQSVEQSDGNSAIHRYSIREPSAVDAQLDVDSVSSVYDRQLVAGFGVLERHIFYRQGEAIAYGCALAKEDVAADLAMASLGSGATSTAAWRHIFHGGVFRTIPEIKMLTLVIDDLSAEAYTIAQGRGAMQSTVVAAPFVDLSGNSRLNIFRSVQVAQLAEAEQLRVELEIRHGCESGSGDIKSSIPLDDALRSIESVLPAYNLPLNLAKRLLCLCRRIHPEWQVERPVDLFQILWTLLGSASVKSLLDVSSSMPEGVSQLIDHRIISDKRQLPYVHPAALPAINTLLSTHQDDERAALIVQLRTLMAQRPTLFATAVRTLAASGKFRDKDFRMAFDGLHQCVTLGIATPLLVEMALSLRKNCDSLKQLVLALGKTGEVVFPNEAMQLAEVAAAFVNACPRGIAGALPRAGLQALDELGREVLYFLYRPVTMDYAFFHGMINQLSDRTRDWSAWSIGGHGEFWNSALKCYEYCLDRGMGQIRKIRLYFSKNVGSFFAKSTAGICTDINVELFERMDHYHLNIIDADDGRAAGNVQLYRGEGKDGPFLLVRGINPIQGFCVNHGVDDLVDCIFHAIGDMAAFGGYSEVRLCEQNGLWNSDSSRAEVRACLKQICADIPLAPMETSFHLYNYYGRALNVVAYYKIWDSSVAWPKPSALIGRSTK